MPGAGSTSIQPFVSVAGLQCAVGSAATWMPRFYSMAKRMASGSSISSSAISAARSDCMAASCEGSTVAVALPEAAAMVVVAGGATPAASASSSRRNSGTGFPAAFNSCTRCRAILHRNLGPLGLMKQSYSLWLRAVSGLPACMQREQGLRTAKLPRSAEKHPVSTVFTALRGCTATTPGGGAATWGGSNPVTRQEARVADKGVWVVWWSARATSWAHSSSPSYPSSAQTSDSSSNFCRSASLSLRTKWRRVSSSST